MLTEYTIILQVTCLAREQIGSPAGGYWIFKIHLYLTYLQFVNFINLEDVKKPSSLVGCYPYIFVEEGVEENVIFLKDSVASHNF